MFSHDHILILLQAGISHVFVNLGSDHPGIMEAIARGKKDPTGSFPKVVTCPHEVNNRSDLGKGAL